MVDRLLDKIGVSEFNWRAFLISLTGIFLMVFIQFLGIKIYKFFTPLPIAISAKKNNVMDIIRPKLLGKTNNFRIEIDRASLKPDLKNIPDNSSAYLVIDYDTGKVLSSKDEYKKLPIASLTKLMTAVVALDLSDPSNVFDISENAANQIPTKIGVVSGQKMTLEELLNAVLLTSANDATEVVKEGINSQYGDDVFIKTMNEKARILGLKSTHFDNPQGFDSKDNYSSAYDLALLSHYALTNYPLISNIVQKDYQLLEANDNHKRFDLYNWNGLVGVYPNVLGVKIGNTENAGKTTIVLSERDGKKILVILLGVQGDIQRDLWSSELLDYGFKEVKGLPAIAIVEEQLRNKYSTWKFWN